MRQKIIFLTAFLFFGITFWGQGIDVSGVVYNNRDKTLIPFATIQSTFYHHVVDADKNGFFKIIVNSTDTLVISSIGFWSDSIIVNRSALLDSFFLSEKIVPLPEVRVGGGKQTHIYGIINKKVTRSSIGSSSDSRFEIATKIEIPVQIKEYKVSRIFLKQRSFNQKHPYKIHIYSVDKDGLPGEEVLKKEIVVSQENYTRDGTITVDLRDHEILLKESSFFVGIQWLNVVSKNLENMTKGISSDFGIEETEKVNAVLTYRRSLIATQNRWYVEYRKAWFFPATREMPVLGNLPPHENPINMIATAEVEEILH